MKSLNHLIWIDLEMTGLVPENDVIIEIATIITDQDLTILAEGPVIAIHQPDSILNAMDAWNTKHHTESGLIARVKSSTYDMKQAESETLAFIEQYIPAKTSPMCGNSICQDRRFLNRYMPSLEAYFHYRHIDVSTLKELVKRWRPDLIQGFVKQSKHLALDDIKESIEELRYYREHFIITQATTSSEINH
jgi:oligoribonuclease